MAKIGSEKRLITGSFADQTLIAYGYIIDEKVHEDKRIFVFSDLNGEDEISEIPITLLALTDHLRSVAIFSDYLKRELESWTKLVFNNDLSQAASTHPDLEIAMMKTALSEYGINSIDDINEEKTNLFLKELQESVIMHEMSHFEVYNALGPDFLGLSSVINEGQNVFCLVNETLADIGALKNLIEISKNDEQKANRMAIQWLALRLKALGNPLEVKTIYMQVTTSLLLSFMERDKETGLKVRFTGEHSLEEGIEKLSQMFLDSTKIAKNEVVSYIGSFFAPGEFPDKAMQIYKQTLEQEHPGVEIPEKLIQQGLLPRMYMFLSKERSQACDNIRDYLGTIGTTFIWDGILNNPDIAGEYAGTKEYEFVNLTAYILDKLKDLGF